MTTKGGQQLYLIGEVSRMGNVSQRTLRYYDDLKLMSPDVISENGYRYYTLETMLRLPVINYYKLMGFSLGDIAEMLNSPDFATVRRRFSEQREACDKELRRLNERRTVIDDWNELIDEANFVLSVVPLEVSVKYLPAATLLAMPYCFTGNHAEAVINLEYTAFVERNDNVISGPVMLMRESYHPILEGGLTEACCDVTMLQKALRPISPEHSYLRESGMYLSAYHVGAMKDMDSAYARIQVFADACGFKPLGSSIERYVTDYWTTYDDSRFVTEILVPIETEQ